MRKGWPAKGRKLAFLRWPSDPFRRVMKPYAYGSYLTLAADVARELGRSFSLNWSMTCRLSIGVSVRAILLESALT